MAAERSIKMKRLWPLRVVVFALVLSLSMPASAVFADEEAKSQVEQVLPKRNTKLKYKYDSNGNFYDAKGYPIHKSTIRNLLETALLPVGKTMYVWGGGWGGVPEATSIGVSPQWEKFFKKQNKNYNYKNTRYQSHNGLDCSGFVGWVLYNTFNTEDGHGSYVMLAQVMAKTFSKWGWGAFKKAKKVKNHMAGDIMSLPSGHVYIVIGQCSDGSVVLVHSSPKGVMINGTVSKKGKKKSKAWKLAKKYMKKYYSAWYKRYPDVRRGKSYLTSYHRMRWSIGKKNSVMSDPEGLRNMSADKVLKIIFHEV